MPVAQAISMEQLDSLTTPQVLADVLKWLSRPDNRRWLLVFDNYDEPDLFAINDFCPGVGHGSIIITTRLPDLVMGTTVRVQPLVTITDSLGILEIRSGRSDVPKGEQYPVMSVLYCLWPRLTDEQMPAHSV